MNKHVILSLLLLLLPSLLAAQQFEDQKKKINSIKKDKAYLYAEITAPDEEEAQSFAEDMLYQEINRYASEQKNLRDAANIVVTNTRSLWEDISLPRGNCYRVFLYVKKADIFGADNVTVSTESALEDETYEEEAYEDTPMSEHRREAISRLLTLRKFSEMESCIKGLKQDGHISSYAGYKDIAHDAADYMLVIYNKDGDIEAILSDGLDRINLRTKQPDDVSNYKERGAIGVKVND